MFLGSDNAEMVTENIDVFMPHGKVRQGLVSAIGGLLSKCSFTPKTSRFTLLECLFVLVYANSDEVSVVAVHDFIECSLMLGEKELIEGEIAEINNRVGSSGIITIVTTNPGYILVRI
ncbi:hypothetical protein MKW98_009242 [Papaver atlanticum]|uniref:Uncharacterized protein n=1 Tax=Papaver atlanticum TaxID=357466 RepID=A0AAD4T458_9MAGN|nr:hypothetical protein MKW98_009242 [Papaver atlanticum]